MALSDLKHTPDQGLVKITLKTGERFLAFMADNSRQDRELRFYHEGASAALSYDDIQQVSVPLNQPKTLPSFI